MYKLFLVGSFYGANACAGSASEALLGIDYVNAVFFFNAAYGAVVCA